MERGDWVKTRGCALHAVGRIANRVDTPSDRWISMQHRKYQDPLRFVNSQWFRVVSKAGRYYLMPEELLESTDSFPVSRFSSLYWEFA